MAPSVSVAREIRSDQSKIYTALEVDGVKIKVELVSEGRVQLTGEDHSIFPVPVLSRADLFTQKLLANDDRGLDRAAMSRDIIDLAMMIQGWGAIPEASWSKAYGPYGDRLSRRFHQAVGMVQDRAYLLQCMRGMEMDIGLADGILDVLHTAAARLPLCPAEQVEFNRRLVVDDLVRTTGAANTLGRHIALALESAGDPQRVDWAAVEIDAAKESLLSGEHSMQSVVDAIVCFSPGAVSKHRQVVIPAWVEDSARRARDPSSDSCGFAQDSKREHESPRSP